MLRPAGRDGWTATPTWGPPPRPARSSWSCPRWGFPAWKRRIPAGSMRDRCGDERGVLGSREFGCLPQVIHRGSRDPLWISLVARSHSASSSTWSVTHATGSPGNSSGSRWWAMHILSCATPVTSGRHRQGFEENLNGLAGGHEWIDQPEQRTRPTMAEPVRGTD